LEKIKESLEGCEGKFGKYRVWNSMFYFSKNNCICENTGGNKERG
jgi:hypothetical protein